MTRYGQTRDATGVYQDTIYGEYLYGELVTNEFDATPLLATPTSYITVLVQWTMPGGPWSVQKLVRNSTGYPVSVDDGTAVLTEDFDAASTDFIDGALTSGRTYYYALFLFDSDLMVWRDAGRDEVLLTKDYGYTQRLFNRIPEVFRTADTENIGGELADTSSFLYRFISVMGLQFDAVRTAIEGLRTDLDARTVSMSILPALSAQVGVVYENEIGARAQRRMVQNAVHLYGLKGTNPGTRELATVVTSWDSGVRIGYNLALDDLDAGPKGSEGRWTGFDDSCTVTYAARRGTQTWPIDGVGFLDITATGGRVDAVINMNRADHDDTFGAMQYAIPIVQGRTYTTSMYASAADGRSANMRVDWLDVQGRSLGTLYDGDSQEVSDIWTARPYVTLTAPIGARYLAASLVFTADTGFLDADEKLRGCGFMVDESETLRPWQCAREVIVQLRAEAINENVYPAPDPPATESTWFSNGTDGTDGTSFTSSGTGQIDAFPGTSGNPVTVANEAGTGYYLYAELAGIAASAQFVMVVTDQNGLTTVETTDPSLTIGGALTAQIAPDHWPANIRKVQFGIRFNGVNGTVTYTHIGVFRSNGPLTYFDGSMATPTSDNLWEGLQYASRSYHYTQRVVRAQRLLALLKDFLPNGSCFTLEFAQPLERLYASPAAIEGVDINPGTPPPPPPVGRSLQVVWDNDVDNGRSMSLLWNVSTLSVGVDLSLQWETLATTDAQLTAEWDVDDDSGPVGAELEVQWQDYQLSSRYNEPTTDEVDGDWTAGVADSTRWLLTNVSDGDYVYPGSGPMYQTGTYNETATDGTVRTGTWAIPNQGDPGAYEMVQAPGGMSNVRDAQFLGAAGEVIYHYYNRAAVFSTPDDLHALWNVAAHVGPTPTVFTDDFNRTNLGYHAFENGGLTIISSGSDHTVGATDTLGPYSSVLPTLVASSKHIEIDIPVLPSAAAPGHYIQVFMCATSGFSQYVGFLIDYQGRLVITDQNGVIAGSFTSGTTHFSGSRLVCDLQSNGAVTMTYDGQTITGTTTVDQTQGQTVLRVDRDSVARFDNLSATYDPSFSDNFTRANADPIGSPYTTISTNPTLIISSDAAVKRSGDSYAASLVSPGFTIAQADIVFTPGSNGNAVLYLYTDANNFVQINWNQQTYGIYELVAGSFSTIYTSFGSGSQSPYTPNTPGQELRAVLSTGNRLDLYLNGAFVHTVYVDAAVSAPVGVGIGTDDSIAFTSLSASS